MRGKVARELRKEVGFIPKENREYLEHEFTRIRKILSYDFEKKGVSIVERPVSVFIKECVTTSRSLYKYLKRKWNNPDYEMMLNNLPEAKDLQALTQTILQDEEVIRDLKEKKKVKRLPEE